MENTEVMNIEETTEVMEPVVTEVAETSEKVINVGSIGLIAAGMVVSAGVALALWKFAIKPGVKKLESKWMNKKRAHASHNEETGEESNVTTVDFEEVKDSNED